MSIAFLQHANIGKSTQKQPWTAAARAGYIANRRHRTVLISEGFYVEFEGKYEGQLRRIPLDVHKIQRFLNHREGTIRKNGRVCDTFILCLQREHSEAQMIESVRRFAREIGKGRAPFWGGIHWEDGNPHFHGIFIDADPESGRRVFGTSEKGSTDLLKSLWANEVNNMFAELGLDTRIEFGTRTEELAQAFNDNEVSEPSPTVAAEEPEVVDEPAPEEEPLAEVVDEPRVDQDELSPREAMAFAGQAVHELRRIRTLQKEREQIKAQYNGAYEAYQRATAAARQAAAEVAKLGLEATAAREAYITEHRGIFGKKGFQISAFGYSYQSPARKAADAAELAYQQSQERAARAAEQSLAETANLEIRTKDFTAAKDKYEAIQGTDQELSEAELLYENTINSYAGNLTPVKAQALVNEGELDNYTARIVLEELGYGEEAKSFDDGIER